MGMGTALGGGPGSGVDAKAGWVDSTRPQPPPPLPPEEQPRRPEPLPQRARLEAAPEGEPGGPDSRAGGDMAPSADGDPPKPERKGPEMPRLFLDLGPPQGNSEQIKGEGAAGRTGARSGARGGTAETLGLLGGREVRLAVTGADAGAALPGLKSWLCPSLAL